MEFLFAIDIQTIFEASEVAMYSYKMSKNYTKTVTQNLPKPLMHTNLGYEEFGTEDERDGCIVQTDRHIFVVFHGTRKTNISDWKTDFSYGTKELRYGSSEKSGGKLHRGFYERTHRFYQLLERLLVRYIHLNLPFIFTGHSMGGALAQISALQFKSKYADVPASVITFGCPKSCDAMLAEQFETTIGFENHVRIIAEDSDYQDIVTKQPPSFVSNLVHPNGRVHKIKPTTKKNGVTCHSMKIYYRALANEVGQEPIYAPKKQSIFSILGQILDSMSS